MTVTDRVRQGESWKWDGRTTSCPALQGRCLQLHSRRCVLSSVIWFRICRTNPATDMLSSICATTRVTPSSVRHPVAGAADESAELHRLWKPCMCSTITLTSQPHALHWTEAMPRHDGHAPVGCSQLSALPVAPGLNGGHHGDSHRSSSDSNQ